MESLSSCRVWASMALTLPFLLLLQVLFEVLNVEVTPGIRPRLAGRPALLTRLGCKQLRRVLVAMLGNNGLVCCERDDFSSDRDDLCPRTDEAHLDAAGVGHPNGLVPEGRQIEIRPQVAVQASQHVKVEFGGDARRIVIGALQDRWVLCQVEADHQAAAGRGHGAGGGAQSRGQGSPPAGDSAHDLHELDGCRGVEVADGGTWEEHHYP